MKELLEKILAELVEIKILLGPPAIISDIDMRNIKLEPGVIEVVPKFQCAMMKGSFTRQRDFIQNKTVLCCTLCNNKVWEGEKLVCPSQ